MSENRRGKPLLLLQEQETGLSKEKQVVEAEAQSRLRTSAYHALHLITCELHEDVLTLRGHVPTFHLKQVAQTLIRDLDGVGGIDNQLEVAESLPANLKRKASSSATGPQGQPIGDRTRSRSGKCFSVPTWHADFLSMLPTIRAHAAVAFGYLDSEAREDAIRDAINNAMHVYVRLVQLNKADLAYPTVLARYALARTKRRTRHLSTGAARARWRPRPPAGAPPLTLSRRTAGHLVSSGSQVVAAAHLTARSAEAGVSGTIPALEPRR